MLEYRVEARRIDAQSSVARTKQAEIVLDTCLAGRSDAFNPAELLLAAGRIGQLRAAVLGANDGIVSTAGLIVGVASASTNSSEVLIAGVAGLVAGTMSMAAGVTFWGAFAMALTAGIGALVGTAV